MFMTFIAISILTAVFITMYLYLIRTHTMASEAERIYAEAAQERLEPILDPRGRDILVNNTGGVGVVIKYLVGLDYSGRTAEISDLPEPIAIPAGGSVRLVDGVNCTFPNGKLYLLTERGNMFEAIPGWISFQLGVDPESIELGNGSTATITLILKAVLLRTPENGTVLIVAQPDACQMTTTTTRTYIGSLSYKNATITAGRAAYVATHYRCPLPFLCIPVATVTHVVDPLKVTVITSIGLNRTTINATMAEGFVERPSPDTITFTTKTKTTITIPITIHARTLDYWDENAECFIWFRVLNATSGSRLAEAGLRVEAAP